MLLLCIAAMLGCGAEVSTMFQAIQDAASYDADTPPPVVSDAGPCNLRSSYAPDEDAGCGPGAVTFQLSGATGDEWWLNTAQGSASESTNWLTLYCVGGSQLYLAPTTDTTDRDCSGCPSTWSLFTGNNSWKLSSNGQTGNWDGTYFVTSNCGAQSLACVTAQCAPPGRYEAHMCACPPAYQASTGCTNPTCMPVTFNYPADPVVVATLPAAHGP